MARPAEIDDWVTPPSANAGGVDDWVTPGQRHDAGADDWVSARPRPTLDAANIREPGLRHRIGHAIAGIGDGPNSFWAQLARKVTGSAGASRTDIGLLDIIPFTAPLMVPGDLSEARNPLEAAAAVAAVIPAPGVGPAAAVAARAASPTASQRVAQAAERLRVTATGATDRAGADLARNIPTVVENPIHGAANRELADIAAATERTLASASPHYSPADASRRGVADWLLGRNRAPADAVAETAALRTADDVIPPPGPRQPQGTQEIVTPNGAMTVRAQPELVELSELQLAAGKNQVRDRGRAEYVREAHERAVNLDPAQLTPGRVSDSGAPIVLQDGTIISGNGRILSIAEVYSNPALAERASAYRASLGTEAANMRQPVRVMRAEAMTPDDAARFGELSNRGRIAQMSATERAARDANAIGRDTVALYQGGEFTSPQNTAFLRAFADRAVTAAERPAFSSGATLTQEGVSRMRAAVLHGAYDDAPLIARMLESTDDNIRALTGALQDAAPGVTQLRADVAAGIVRDDMDMTRQLTDAVKLIADLRSRGISPATHFAQRDAFSQTDEVVEAFVRSFYNDDLTRPISRQKIADVVNAYTVEARKHAPAGASLFPDETTRGDVLNVAARARGTGDEAVDLLSGVPEPVGARVRDGGPVAQRSEVAGVGEAAPAGGQGTQGVGSAAAVGDGATGQAGQRVVSATQSERIVTQNLIEARKAAISKAVGLPVQGVTPEAITARLVEMARSRLPADVNGLIRARELIGNDGWRDVMAGVLHRLGAREGGWDVVQFATAWSKMTANGQRALFGGVKGMPKGFQRTLGDLATLGERIPRLQQLTQSDLPPLLGKVLNSKGANVIGWLVLHPLSGFTTALPQVSGWALAKFLARPMAAERASMWARAMAEFAKEVNPRSVAMLRFATQELVELGEDDGAAP